MATKEVNRRGLDDVMTVAQVADYLHLNKLTIYRYIRERKLPAVKLGRTFRVMRDDVHRFLEAQRIGPAVKTEPKRTVGRASTTTQPQPERDTQDRPEEYLDPRQDIVQPRETLLTNNPLDWVIRGLH